MNIDLPAKRKFLARAASSYAEADYLDHAVADDLLQRLRMIKWQPKSILNIGAKDDYTSKLLRNIYSAAEIFSLEIHEEYLNPSDLSFVAESEKMPIQNASVDMIFSNLFLHSVFDFQKTLQEFRRILKPGGLLFFCMLGRDTLKELRECFFSVSSFPHIYDYFDMHDVGDILMKEHFLNPVLDVDQMTIQFSSPLQLIEDIRKSGQNNAHIDRQSTLMAKSTWKKMLAHYDRFANNQKYPASFEIIYGHAWTSEHQHATQNEKGEILFPVNLLKPKTK